MGCSSCGCNPCQCVSVDANNEALVSQVDNLITSIFGTVSKTVSNGMVLWNLPCNLQNGVDGFPRMSGEGTNCYLLRLFTYLNNIIAGGGSGLQPLCNVLTSLCALGYPASGKLLGSNGAGGISWNDSAAVCAYVTQLCALTLVKGDILYVNAGGAIARLPIGANGQFLTNIAGIPGYQVPATTFGGAFLMEETQASGVAGGTFTSGAWQKRTLNSIAGDPSSLVVSLIASEFVLVAGTYLLKIKCPAYKVNTHQARLFNVTDASVIHYSNNGIEAAGENDGGYAIIDALFTIGAAKTLRVEHQCQTTEATDGFGLAPGAFWTNVGTFTTVTGIKIA